MLIVNGRSGGGRKWPTDGAVESDSYVLSSVRLPRSLGTLILVRVPATGGDENPRVVLGRGPSEFRSFRRQPPMPPPPRVRRVTEPDSQRRARDDAPAVFAPARHKRLAKMGCAGSRAGRQRAALGSRCAWWRVQPTATAATTDIEAGPGKDIMNGGWGKDAFYSGSDGSRDEIHCGGGYDFVEVREQIDYVALTARG